MTEMTLAKVKPFDSADSVLPPEPNSWANHMPTPGRLPEKARSRPFSDIFLSCFAPPLTDSSSRGSSTSTRSKSTSDSGGSIRGKWEGSSRSIYGSSHKSNQAETPAVKFTIEEIYRATGDFSPAREIGHGGFGIVYKGTLDDGTVVAVKRSRKAKEGEQEMNLNVEFQNEIRMLEHAKHMNLVRFFGYLEHKDERLIVVEYVPNGNLREHLDCTRGGVLDLTARIDIAIGVAHAITYLHIYTDNPIIHRDIKSSNILLNEHLKAKVADFGIARLAPDMDNTHVTTEVKGTAGYVDPEYLKTKQLTEKSDIYSFGVLLVELVSGRRPIEPKRVSEDRVTAVWAFRKYNEGDVMSVLDQKLDHTVATKKAIERILELAIECLAPSRHKRPNMKTCAEILWGIRKDYRDSLASDFCHLSA